MSEAKIRWNKLRNNHRYPGPRVQEAYERLAKGTKFGAISAADGVPAGQMIQFWSNSNLKQLKSQLFPLQDDERELLEHLLRLPYRCQHATPHFYSIEQKGACLSYEEMRRGDQKFKSKFSTNANVKLLGNDDFVFFRLYVEGSNGATTRYGDSTLVCDLEVIEQFGWISLHDQLNPFPSPTGRGLNVRSLTRDGRLLRLATPCAYDGQKKRNDKTHWGGLKYTYRNSECDWAVEEPDGESFMDAHRSSERTIPFVHDIFFGSQIRLGIALSVLAELRALQPCGFRARFLNSWYANSEANRTTQLAELIRDFFHIEAKLPVSLKVISDKAIHSTKYLCQPFRSKIEFPLTVVNRDGDGRKDSQLRENEEQQLLASAREELRELQLAQDKGWLQKDKDRESKLAQLRTIVNADALAYQRVLNKIMEHFPELDKAWRDEAPRRFSRIKEKLECGLELLEINFIEGVEELESVLSFPFEVLQALTKPPLRCLVQDDRLRPNELMLSRCTSVQLHQIITELTDRSRLLDAIIENHENFSTLFEVFKDNEFDFLVSAHKGNLCYDLLETSHNVNRGDRIVHWLRRSDEYDDSIKYVLEELSRADGEESAASMNFKLNMGLYDEPLSDSDASFEEEPVEPRDANLRDIPSKHLDSKFLNEIATRRVTEFIDKFCTGMPLQLQSILLARGYWTNVDLDAFNSASGIDLGSNFATQRAINAKASGALRAAYRTLPAAAREHLSCRIQDVQFDGRVLCDLDKAAEAPRDRRILRAALTFHYRLWPSAAAIYHRFQETTAEAQECTSFPMMIAAQNRAISAQRAAAAQANREIQRRSSRSRRRFRQESNRPELGREEKGTNCSLPKRIVSEFEMCSPRTEAEALALFEEWDAENERRAQENERMKESLPTY